MADNNGRPTTTDDRTSMVSQTETVDVGTGMDEGTEEAPLISPIIRDGRRACLVCLGAFILQVLIVGILQCWGFFLLPLTKGLNSTRSQFSWVGSLAYGLSMLFGPLAGILVAKYDAKRVTCVGCCICCLSVIITSFVQSMSQMFGTFSLLYGLGTSFAYIPTMTIAQDFFDKYLSVATGVICAGSSAGTLVMSPILEKLIDAIGWRNSMRCYAGMCLIAAAACLLFQRPPRPQRNDMDPDLPPPSLARNIIEELAIWNNRVFIIWSMSLTLVFFGVFIPGVHMVAYAKSRGISQSDCAVIMMVYGGSTAVGRVIFGKVTTFSCMDRLHMQQLSLMVCGGAIMMLPSIRTFAGLIVYVLAVGLVDGCFLVLMPLLTATFVGNDKATTAWGFVTMACSATFMLGPPVIGWIYEAHGNYDIAFRVAGIPQILAAILLLFIPWAISSSQDVSAISTTSFAHGHEPIDEDLLLRLTIAAIDVVDDMDTDNVSLKQSLFNAHERRTSILSMTNRESLSSMLQSPRPSTAHSGRFSIDTDPTYAKKLNRYMHIMDQYKKIMEVRRMSDVQGAGMGSLRGSIRRMGTSSRASVYGQMSHASHVFKAKDATSLELAGQYLRNTHKSSWILGQYSSMPKIAHGSQFSRPDMRWAPGDVEQGLQANSNLSSRNPSAAKLYDANVDMTAGISTAELSMVSVSASPSTDAAIIEAEKIKQTVDARMEANMQESLVNLEHTTETHLQPSSLAPVLEMDGNTPTDDQRMTIVPNALLAKLHGAKPTKVLSLIADYVSGKARKDSSEDKRASASIPVCTGDISAGQHPVTPASPPSPQSGTHHDMVERTSSDGISEIAPDGESAEPLPSITEEAAPETAKPIPSSSEPAKPTPPTAEPAVPQGILIVPTVPYQCPSPVELCTSSTIRKKGVRFQDGILPTIPEEPSNESIIDDYCLISRKHS